MSKFLPADRSSRRSRSWMLASAVLACSGGADVYAASGDFIQTEEVVVLGRRPIAESEMAALEAQRNYPSLVSIVSADTVGRFPDQNIAFAVGRLPGIGIQRDQGQARYVNLRGAPNNWTTISFDGINVVSPEGRTSRFDNIPSALAAQIEARKAVTADMPGETLAGNVNIVTRSPFDYDGFHVQANSGIGYVGLGGNEEVDTSLVLSNKFADDTFGVLVSGSYYHRNMVTDNTETDWEPVSADAGLPGAGDRPLWAREHENKLYRLTRRNFSWSGRLGWRPEANHELFLSSIYTTFEDDELRSNIRWDLDDRQSGTPDTPCADRPNGGATVSGGASGYADVCTGNTPFVGTVYGVDFIDNFNDLESKESIFTNTLGGDHALSNGWEIAWRLNYTNTEDGVNAPALTDYNSPSDRLLRPTVAYDLSDPDRQRAEVFRTVLDADGNYTRGERVIAVENFQRDLVRLRRRWGGTKTDAYTARVTGLRQFDFGTPVDLKLGLEWSDRTKTDEERIFDIDDDGIIAAGLPRDFSAIALDEPYLGDLELGYTFRYHSSNAARRLVDQAIASGQGGFEDVFNYEVTEEWLAGFVMATAYFDWGNVILGTRYERTDNTGRAPTVVELANGDEVVQLTESESSDTLWFPSLHLNYDLTEDMKLRFSVNTGAARPDFDDLRPGFEVNDEEEIASGGNPAATPERAWGVDAYYEWYLQPRGIFQVGVFHKQIEDVLFNSSTRLGDVSFPDGIDRSDFVLNTLVNGFEGEITGFEIAYQQPAELLVERLGLPGWLGGFGIQVNATFTDSEAETPDNRKVPLRGTSDMVFNLIPYYEKYGLSVRLAYQKRTEWLDSVSIGGITNPNGGDTYWDDDAELDLSVRYAFNDHVEWYFDAVNIARGPGVRWASNPIYQEERETFGERYIMGLRLNW